MSKQRLKVTIEACCDTCKMRGFALCNSVSTNPCGGYVPQVLYLQSKINEAKNKNDNKCSSCNLGDYCKDRHGCFFDDEESI